MEARQAAALLALAACIACSAAAPMANNQTALDLYDGAPEGCYYNFQHYGEGDRIMTNEPCLNCTCHNRMLMCYLRVCPFTKPIGQDCTVEKRADQCCPIVTCPDVPVDLLTSTSTSSPAEYGATGIGHQDKYGCSINGRYFPEGSKVPPTPNKPCEHCYCIRNMTTCVMQECTLHVDGCVPIYHKDVCCPVRYSCDHPEDDIKLLDDMTTTVRPTPGFLLTTTTLSPVTQVSQDCVHDDQVFADGALIKTEKACEHCYCMKGDIVCVVQECGTPMENEGKNCTSLPPRQGQCCPDTYICEGDELATGQTPELTTEDILKSTSITPPRKGIEGSGYRNEPDEPYTDLPIFEIEGSGEPIDQSESLTPEKPTPDLADEMFLTTAKQFESKPTSATELDIDFMVTKSETSNAEITTSHETKYEMVTVSTKSDVNEDSKTVSQNEVTEITRDYKATEQPLLTTLSDFISSTVGGSLINVENQSDKMTESTLSKEDDVFTLSEATTQNTHDEITTENEYYGQKVTKEDKLPITSTSVLSEEDNEKKLEISGGYTINEDEPRQTTTEIVKTADTDKEVKESVNKHSSTTTRMDTFETTSLNPTENEIDEDLSQIVSPGRIPGEGDCLLNGITYKNTTAVPSVNKCHTSCRCISSIIKCDPIICSPPPEYANMNNCEPIYDSAESCCPTYICDHSKEGTLPESHSQMSGTESSKPIGNNECIGDECLTNEDKHTLETIQPKPCATENCDLPENHPMLPECGKEGCVGAVPSAPEHPVECDKNTGCQVTAVRPCEGENCKDVITSEAETHISSSENQGDVSEKECSNDSCRRKEVSEVEIKLPSSCVGTECVTETQTETIKSKLTTSKLPIEEITKTSFVPTTISSESYTFRTEEKSTTLEETSSKYDSTTRIVDAEEQEPTTDSVKHVQIVSDSGITREPETFTTELSEVEGIPNNSFDSALDMSTAIAETIGGKDYLTTSSHSLAPEPTISEEKPELQQTISDLNKDYTTLPQTSKVESQGMTTSEEGKLTIISLESPGISIQAQTTSDEEKSTGTINTHYENTTPVLGGDLTNVETYSTELLISEQTNQPYHEMLSTTIKYAARDDDHTTETSKLTYDGTTSELITEYSTSSPHYQGFGDKTTVDTTVNLTEKSITNLLDNFSVTKTKDESTTTYSNLLETSSDQESVTESAKETESVSETDEQPTEKSPEHTINETIQVNDKTPAHQHEISSIAPDSHQYEKGHQETPEIAYTTENPTLNIKETIKEKPSAELPVSETAIINEIIETTEQDVMESLNGRATEGPDLHVHDDLQAVTSQSQEPDLYTTELAQTIASFDEKQSESASTEKTRHTTENEFEQDIKTETVKVVTDSITTKPERGDVTSEDENLADDKAIINETTTVRIDTTTQTVKEEAEDKKEETVDEVTQIEDHISSTESIKDTSEYNTDTHLVTLEETHIAQSDSTESLSLVTEHTIPDQHEVELTTTGLYADDKEKIEDYSEGSGDINKQQESQNDRDEQHTFIPTKLSDEIPTEEPSWITTVLPGISENTLYTTLPEEAKATESPTLLVTENILPESLPTRRVADHDTEVTISLEEEITTQSSLTETITDKLDLTTKTHDLSEIEDKEKVTVALHGSDKFYGENETTKTDITLEEKLNEKATTIPESFTTEKQHITNAVTQKDSELTSPTEFPVMLTSKSIATEQETVTGKLSTSDPMEKSTEEPDKTTAKHHYTESIVESENVDSKDVSTGMPDIATLSTVETETTKLSQTTQDISRTTAFPDFGIIENIHTESEQTTIKTPEINIDLEENTVNIEDSDVTEITKSPAIITEIHDIQKQTPLYEEVATTLGELLPHETSSPEITYTEKITESPEKTEYTEIISTESSRYPSKPTDLSAVHDDGSSIDKIVKEVTIPEFITDSVVITTESSNLEEILRETKIPIEKITEETLTNVEDSEKEIDFATDKPMIEDHVTEKFPEYYELDDTEKTTPAGQTPTKEAITEMPQYVTDSIKESDNIDYSQKEKESPSAKVPEADEGRTTVKPEKSTIISEYEEKSTAESSDLFIPIETSSHLPEKSKETEEVSTVSDEQGIEQSTETSKISKPKPLESAFTTESSELLTTSKSSENLNKVDLTITTKSSDAESVDKTSDVTPVTDSLPTEISQETSSDKTIFDAPHTLTSISSENDIFEGTTLKTVQEKTTEIIQSNIVQETNTKTESQETTSEKEQDNAVNINIEGEDKTLAYAPEQYTETPEQTFTELHTSPSQSSVFLTESDITVTEKSDIITHSPEKYTTNVENGQTFTDEKHEHFTTIPEGLITQQVETEINLPVTLSTERLLTTQEIETNEHLTKAPTDATKAPELNKYTTELDDIATPTLIEQTLGKETIKTELPITVITSHDEYTQDVHREVFSGTKETKPDYTTTEKIEISTKTNVEVAAPLDTESHVLQFKPTGEGTAHPENTEETSERMEEHSESTPYSVELEEHTHKRIEGITPEVYHEEVTSTTKPEILYPDNHLNEISTEKQEIEQLTDIITEKQETGETTKITTEKQETDESMRITTEKQDTDVSIKITTERQETEESTKITTEKQETDESTKTNAEKQESAESTKSTTDKQEYDETMKITTEKQETDDSTKIYAVETPITFAPSHTDLGTPAMTYEISTAQPVQDDKITTLSPSLTEIETDITKHSSMLYDKDITTIIPAVTTTSYEEAETLKQEEHTTVIEIVKESAAVKPTESIPTIQETTVNEEEFIPAATQSTTGKIIEEITTLSPTHSHKFSQPEEKPIEPLPSTSSPELHKPGFNEILPTDDIPSTDEESHFPPTGSSGYGQEPDYGEEDQAFGPGTCRYGGKVYVSAQQIPRDDPCDFCFCFRSDIICLQQSCPPPIHGCHEEPIQGFCCPRYECPVSMATTLNITTTTTTTTTTLPPHFLPHAYKGAAQRRGCQIKGHTYKVGEVVRASSGPCLHCTCGGDGQMKCDPKACTPEPMLRQMIAAAVSAKRRR